MISWGQLRLKNGNTLEKYFRDKNTEIIVCTFHDQYSLVFKKDYDKYVAENKKLKEEVSKLRTALKIGITYKDCDKLGLV